jgi:signal transducing adaptor molecule
VLKRLAHRNPNVQIYALSVVESLSKNCGKPIHSEIASRAFTQGLEKLITDRVRHNLFIRYCLDPFTVRRIRTKKYDVKLYS